MPSHVDQNGDVFGITQTLKVENKTSVSGHKTKVLVVEHDTEILSM